MFGDFNIPLSIIDQTSKKKITKNMKDSNNPISQIDLIYIYTLFYPTISKRRVPFFSIAHRIFTKLDCIGLLKASQ